MSLLPPDKEGETMSKSTKECRKGCEVYKSWLACEGVQAELAKANEKIGRLQDEIRARRQWQTCPACSRIFATQL